MDGYYIKDKYYPNWIVDKYEVDAWYCDNLKLYRCEDNHYHWEIWGHVHATGKKALAMAGSEDTFDEASKICAEMVNAMSGFEEPHEPITKRLN